MILATHPAWRDPAWVTSVATLLTALAGLWGGFHIGRQGSKAAARSREETRAAIEETLEAAQATKEQVTNHHPSNLRDDVSEIQVQVAQTREQLAHLTDMFVAGQQASAARDDALRSSVDSINARSEQTHDAIFSRLRDIESGRGRRVRKD